MHGCLLNSHLARRRHWQFRNEGIWNIEDTAKVNDSHLLLLLEEEEEEEERKQRKREIRFLLYLSVV